MQVGDGVELSLSLSDERALLDDGWQAEQRLGGQGSDGPFAECGLRTRRGRWSDAARGSVKGLGLGLGFLGLGYWLCCVCLCELLLKGYIARCSLLVARCSLLAALCLVLC